MFYQRGWGRCAQRIFGNSNFNEKLTVLSFYQVERHVSINLRRDKEEIQNLETADLWPYHYTTSEIIVLKI